MKHPIKCFINLFNPNANFMRFYYYSNFIEKETEI